MFLLDGGCGFGGRSLALASACHGYNGCRGDRRRLGGDLRYGCDQLRGSVHPVGVDGSSRGHRGGVDVDAGDGGCMLEIP